ncbi:MAG: hypothetical protein IPP90_00460 [Gemmatimonadaceae bacterium]|nr:hypothetical protein [Gemmatimonadaceae bacterium]
MRLIICSALSAALVVTSACDDNRSTKAEPVGALGFGTNFAKTATNLPRGTVTFPVAIVASATPNTDSVIVTLAGLDSLSSGTYTVWLANDSATKFVRVTNMNLTITRLDSTINAAGDPQFTPTVSPRVGVSGFKLGGSNYALRVATARDAATGIAATDSLNVVVVSIETAATPGASPGEVRPLWARRSQASAARVAGLRFGTFGRAIPVSAGAPAANQEYTIATSSTAGVATMTIVPRGRVEVRGKIMIANDSNYFRPPVGYYYNAYAVKFDTTGRFNDTVYVGRRTAPYPDRTISLYEVDKTNPAPNAVFDTPRVIYAMASRVSTDTIPKANSTPPWYNFGLVRVNLQSKYSTEGRMGPNTVLEATLPKSVRGR